MIPNIVFIIARYVFLAILYIFIILVIRTIYRDLRSPAPAQKGRRRRRQPQLVLIEGPKKLGGRLKISTDLTLGRSPMCQVVLDDVYASQKHARIFQEGARILVEDLGSTNGTYLNGRKVNYPTELRKRDQIKIGKTVFEFRE